SPRTTSPSNWGTSSEGGFLDVAAGPIRVDHGPDVDLVDFVYCFGPSLLKRRPVLPIGYVAFCILHSDAGALGGEADAAGLEAANSLLGNVVLKPFQCEGVVVRVGADEVKS